MVASSVRDVRRIRRMTRMQCGGRSFDSPTATTFSPLALIGESCFSRRRRRQNDLVFEVLIAHEVSLDNSQQLLHCNTVTWLWIRGVTMDMPTIRIDQDVWVYLQSKAKPFEDSPNDVLRRELGLNRPAAPEQTPADVRISSRPHDGSLIPADRDYTHHRVSGYKLDGKQYPANSFKEVLIGVSNQLRREHLQEFDKVAMGLFGKKRVYFSQNAKDLRYPHRLSDSNLFVETNLNANLIAGICRSLLEALSHDIGDFEID